MDWVKEIGVMLIIKSEVTKADRQKIWPYALPRVAADAARIATVERALGFSLDEQYRTFLRHADGWPAFLQAVDLFGTAELLGNEHTQRAHELLGQLDPAVFEASQVAVADLLPIAASPYYSALFVLTKPTSARPGEVIWFGNDEVDRYPSFEEYFLSMADYNRNELAALANA